MVSRHEDNVAIISTTIVMAIIVLSALSLIAIGFLVIYVLKRRCKEKNVGILQLGSNTVENFDECCSSDGERDSMEHHSIESEDIDGKNGDGLNEQNAHKQKPRRQRPAGSVMVDNKASGSASNSTSPMISLGIHNELSAQSNNDEGMDSLTVITEPVYDNIDDSAI